MNYSDIYFSSNEQLRLEDLISINKEIFDSLDKSYWNENYQNISFEQWKNHLEKKGYIVERIKKNKNNHSIRQFFYVGDYYTVEIQMLDPDWLLSEMTIGCLKVDDMKKEDFLNKKYDLYFFPEWNTFAIDYFIRLYKEIDKDQLWEVFKSMYIYANYGFDMFPKNVLEEVFSSVDNTSSINQLEDLKVIDSEGYLTIYRGEGRRSTSIEKSYSWTIKDDIAYKFANHFERGRLYKGKVKAKNIINYIDERNEKEVLVRFEDIVNIEIIQDYL